MKTWHHNPIAFLLVAIFVLSTTAPTAGFQKPGNMAPEIPLPIAGRLEAGSVAGEVSETRPSDQHLLFLPLVMTNSGLGPSVPVQVHAAFDDGSGNAGAQVGAGVIIRVDGVEKGITDASSAATIPLLPGSHTLEAVLPSLAIGQQAITVTAGQSNSITVLLDGNRDVIEPSQLTIDELVNGGLPLDTPTLTLRFLKNGATVPMTHLWEVELSSRDPNFQPIQLTPSFHVTPSGTVATGDTYIVNNVLSTLESDAVVDVIASDARGFSYEAEVAFAPGLYTLNGQLAAPPSQPALPLGDIVLQATFGDGITKIVTSSSTGAFTLTQVPGGMLNLSGVTTSGGNVYNASAYVAVDGNQNLLVRPLGLTDILAGVVPWEITPAPGAGLARPALGQAVVQTQRKTGSAETPSHSPSAPATGARVIVLTASKGLPMTGSATLNVPKGTKQVVLKYTVSTAEYPEYVLSQSHYDDTWTLWVLASSGAQLFSIGRSVNSQLYVPPTWNSAGSTGIIQEVIDVAQLAANADIQLTVYATATNVRDEAAGTMVDATLDFIKTITIDQITRDTVSPTNGASDHYSIPRSDEANTYQRHFDVTYTKPDDVNITNVKVELMANGTVLQNVVDGAPGSAGIEVLNAKTLRIQVTFGNIASAVPSTPPPADQILYRFTLKGQDSSGTELKSEPKESPQFYALWRMPDGLPRYGTRDNGGDDWAAQATYTWLDNNRALVTKIDDISGEHARNIGHETHYDGKGIDMFHVYTFPGSGCGESGARNYLCLEQSVLNALGGDATAKSNVAAWATQTRNRFDLLLNDGNVQHIYYTSGNITTTTTLTPTSALTPTLIKLDAGWARTLLQNGRYTNPDNIVLDLGIGTWTHTNDPRVTYNAIHNSHFHVTLR